MGLQDSQRRGGGVVSTDTDEEESQLAPIYPYGKLDIGDEHYPPQVVRLKLLAWAAQRPVHFSEVMHVLRWHSTFKCWAFYYTGIFHGVETDGYIHT